MARISSEPRFHSRGILRRETGLTMRKPVRGPIFNGGGHRFHKASPFSRK